MQYNQLKYFRPFEHQKRFFLTGTQATRRGLIAANRTGKTVATCYELAYHLTGDYPDWWTGKRWDRPISAFAAGESWDQVARVLQEELIGTSDSKLLHAIGTGAIPRDRIVIETMRNDGANVMSIEVRHKSGQLSRLLFGNYTQEVRNMQGFKMDIVVFDEQPPDDMFSELVTRTATLQGQIFCSFTPLKGTTGLVGKFLAHERGYEFIQVGWDDLPEYSPWGEPFLLKETREQMLLDYMPHEREARTQGKPVMGKGAIFPLKSWPTYTTGTFKFSEMPELRRIIALDLGLVNDSTVISLMYWHPYTKEAWLDVQITVTGIDEANPTSYVQHLLRPEVFGTPIVLPADAGTAGRYTMSALSLREFFEGYNLNVYQHPIMNPKDSEGRVTNHKAYGINMMRQMLEAGTLHINDRCHKFLTEAQNYYVDEKGRYSDPDDHIDSARYAVLGCLNDIAEPYHGGRDSRMIAAKNRIEQITADRAASRTGLRQVMNPEGH
jgi:phage terminase large subunit-like protein